MCQEDLEMERSHGEEWVEGKCRKDKGHYLWYRPGPLAEFRRILMHCLSYRSRQQQHLLQWLKKFRELQPFLTSHNLSYKTHGHVYSSCVRSPVLHASETWPLTKMNLQRLQRNDRATIRQICSIKPEDG